MANVFFPEISKSTRLDDGTTYAYARTTAGAGKPTFLLLHGFPGTSYDWRRQVQPLTDAGYGVIAPDLLGYGGTDKPKEPEAYSRIRMAKHMAELVKKEGLDKVIAVGHDHGSGLLSGFAHGYPDLCIGVAFLAFGYATPGAFDIDAINAMTEAHPAIGRPLFAYWKFFGAEDAAGIIEKNMDSFMSVAFPEDPSEWLKTFCVHGAMRKTVEAGKIGPLASYLPKDEAEKHAKVLLDGGMTGPLNWYKSLIKGVDVEATKHLSEEDMKIHMPTLLVTTGKDVVCLPAIQVDNAQKYITDLTVENLDSSHWVMVEKPKEVVDLLLGFAKKLTE